VLEEKLRQAGLLHAKKSKRILYIIATATFVCIAFITIIVSIDFRAPPSMPEIAASVKAVAPQDSSRLREQFMLKLRIYETELVPALSGINFKTWNARKELSMRSLKERAIASFATGDYAAALREIADSSLMAEQLLSRAEETFSAELTMAGNALAGNRAIESRLHIKKALLVKPDDREALILAKRIHTLPQLIVLLKKAAIAQTENNLEKELSAVSEAFGIAPYRQQLKQRKEVLEEKLSEDRFTRLIALGLENVKKRLLRKARSNYRKAKSLYAGRSELHILNAAIGRLAIDVDLAMVKAQAKAAIDQDNWAKAQAVFAVAVRRHPGDKAIRDGLQLSTRLVSMQNRLANYLRQPERLAAKNVSAAAKQTLDQARTLIKNSRSLSRKITELASLLTVAARKIPVNVKSDNQTYILVRGIGKVGLIREKTIQLKPGFYTFEGLREGYKSKLVEVSIPVGTISFGVEVVCDERI